LNQNLFGELGTDAETDVANLANDARVLADQFDFLFLTKAHLAQAMRDLGRGHELLDAHGGALSHLVQRTDQGLTALI
jgi:hypothetical protein